MLTEQEEEQKIEQLHLGIIPVSMSILKGLLLLPDEYQVVSVHVDASTNRLQLVVSSPALPQTEEGQRLPVVSPVYSRIETEPGQYKTVLTDIRVETY